MRKGSRWDHPHGVGCPRLQALLSVTYTPVHGMIPGHAYERHAWLVCIDKDVVWWQSSEVASLCCSIDHGLEPPALMYAEADMSFVIVGYSRTLQHEKRMSHLGNGWDRSAPLFSRTVPPYTCTRRPDTCRVVRSALYKLEASTLHLPQLQGRGLPASTLPFC